MPDFLGDFTWTRGDAPWTLPIYETDNSPGGTGGSIDLTAYGTAVRCQLRPSVDSDVIYYATCDISNLAGTVDSSPTAPRLTISLTADQTTAMGQTGSDVKYVADVEFTGGAVSPLTLYSFTLTIVRDVTHD